MRYDLYVKREYNNTYAAIANNISWDSCMAILGLYNNVDWYIRKVK